MALLVVVVANKLYLLPSCGENSNCISYDSTEPIVVGLWERASSVVRFPTEGRVERVVRRRAVRVSRRRREQVLFFPPSTEGSHLRARVSIVDHTSKLYDVWVFYDWGGQFFRNIMYSYRAIFVPKWCHQHEMLAAPKTSHLSSLVNFCVTRILWFRVLITTNRHRPLQHYRRTLTRSIRVIHRCLK